MLLSRCFVGQNFVDVSDFVDGAWGLSIWKLRGNYFYGFNNLISRWKFNLSFWINERNVIWAVGCRSYWLKDHNDWKLQFNWKNGLFWRYWFRLKCGIKYWKVENENTSLPQLKARVYSVGGVGGKKLN